MRSIALSCLAAAVGAGCAASDPPPSSSSASCQSTVISLCKASCTCGATDTLQACALGTYVDGAGGGALSWASATACEIYFAFACTDASVAAGFNYAACSTALTTATCAPTVNGPALLFPQACNMSLPDAGADSEK